MGDNNGFDNYSDQYGYGYSGGEPGKNGNDPFDYTPNYSNPDRSVWNTPAPSRGKRVCGRLSYTFGIIALCAVCTGSGLPFAIAAIILGKIGMDADYNVDKAEKGRRFGAIAVVLNVLIIITCLILKDYLENRL